MNRPDTDRTLAPTGDVVELMLPIGHKHIATARVVAASLGADAGFDVDQIDDFRLAVDEAVAIVVDAAGAEAERVALRFEPGPGAVTVRVAAQPPAPLTLADIDALALRIVKAVADEFDVADGALVVVKRATAGDVVA